MAKIRIISLPPQKYETSPRKATLLWRNAVRIFNFQDKVSVEGFCRNLFPAFLSCTLFFVPLAADLKLKNYTL